MAATVRSTSTYASAASETTAATTLPSGWQPGDVIYIGWELTATNGTVTTPGGWTAAVAGFAAAGVTNAHSGVLRRVMQAGDTAPTISFTSGRFAADLVAVQGADNGTPEDVTPTTDDNTGVTTPSVRAPSITPVTPGCLLITFHAVRNGTNGVSTAFTPDGSETEQADVSSAVAAISNAAIEAATLALTDTSATGTKTATATGSNVSSINMMGSALAVRAAPAGGGITQAQPGQTWLRRFHHRQQLFATASTLFAVALAETGAADDSSFTVAATVPLAEAGTGADTLAVSAAVPLAESGTGADTLAVTAAVPLAESGSGADTLVVTVAVPLAEAGTGADSLTVTAAVPLAESGTGTDTLSVNAGGTPALAESGTAADTLTVLAALALTEAGSALDALAAGPQVTVINATSTPTVTAQDTSLATAAGAVRGDSVAAQATSAAGATDPRDGTSQVTAAATSTSAVSDG